MIGTIINSLLAYLLGSVSGSLLLGRLRHVDIRSAGSGNAGGTNAFRTQGFVFALGVVIIDIGKGVLAALLPGWFAWGSIAEPSAPLWCAMAAGVGHCYPVWHGFRGGKGAATAVGALTVIQPITLIPDTGIFGTTDLNGDGASFTDAYLGNSDRAPGVSRNSDRLSRAATVDMGLRWQPQLGDGRLELSADIFNLFNRENLSGFANSATQSNQIQVFGQPFTRRNAGAPRQFQFGLRYLF